VTDTKFCLCFLRAEHFNPTKTAVLRLEAFLEGKLQYFGEALLTKPIKFSDLDKDDQACLKMGHMQVLPSRNRAGRAVCCNMDLVKDRKFKLPVNRIKAWIYILMTLAEDEENQKRGIVVFPVRTTAGKNTHEWCPRWIDQGISSNGEMDPNSTERCSVLPW
jgi:hypothetical protein